MNSRGGTTNRKSQSLQVADSSLLLIENDSALTLLLAQVFKSWGFSVRTSHNLSQGMQAIEHSAPAFAVIDLKLPDGNGLAAVSALKRKRSDARAVVLTGYGSPELAATAVKKGAVNFFIKPADVDDIIASLVPSMDMVALPKVTMSADRMWWEHINRIFLQCDQNVSMTARRLGMHRRTLQRIISRGPPD